MSVVGDVQRLSSIIRLRWKVVLSGFSGMIVMGISSWFTLITSPLSSLMIDEPGETSMKAGFLCRSIESGERFVS